MKEFIVSMLGIFGFIFVVSVPESGPQFAWNMIWSTGLGMLMCWMSYKLSIIWKVIDVNEKV